MPKSNPLKSEPIIDIKTAITISFLFESSNFFTMPIRTNAKHANAKMSTQNSNNPPTNGKTSHAPRRFPLTKCEMKNPKKLTRIPMRYNINPLLVMASH